MHAYIYICMHVRMHVHACMYVYRYMIYIYIHYTVCTYLLVFMAIKCRGAKFRWCQNHFVSGMDLIGSGVGEYKSCHNSLIDIGKSWENTL